MTPTDLRERWADFYRLSPNEQALINGGRWFTVEETSTMFERAIAEEWFGKDERNTA